MDYIFRLTSFTNFNSEVFVKKVQTDNAGELRECKSAFHSDTVKNHQPEAPVSLTFN